MRVSVLWATQAGDTFTVFRKTASDDKTAMWKLSYPNEAEKLACRNAFHKQD